MSSPVATVPSPSSRYEKVKSTILSSESPSTPDSSMSLMDNSQSPGWIRDFSLLYSIEIRGVFSLKRSIDNLFSNVRFISMDENIR